MAGIDNIQSDLFGFSVTPSAGDYFQPLAERVRPRTLDDVAGQEHLVGATTENPSFEVNGALLSRMQVYILNPLGTEAIEQVIRRALKEDRLLKELFIEIADLDFLLQFSGGDARKALNAVEAALSLLPEGASTMVLSRELLERALQYKAPMYDKGGEDPKFIARRMVIFASEDVGNADPYAITLAISVFQAVVMIGMPEARINLAQGVTYLASVPKSNASYQGINEAMSFTKSNPELPVPLHLRNAPTKLMKPKAYYRPGSEGREKYIRERLGLLWSERYKP